MESLTAFLQDGQCHHQRWIISNPRTLSDIATVVRSKNAGPYDITVDILFDSQAVYQLVKASDILTSDVISRLYNIPVSEVIWAGFYDAALALQGYVSSRKRNGKMVAAGGFMENDVHASQHHVELLTLGVGRGTFSQESWLDVLEAE